MRGQMGMIDAKRLYMAIAVAVCALAAIACTAAIGSVFAQFAEVVRGAIGG